MSHALLIDGENVGSHTATAILRTIPPDSAVRRVYGDVARLNGWTKVHGLGLHHVPPGQNTTDMAISIDAVALCHRDGVRSFTLATGDADFVRLLTHLREAGCTLHLAAPPNTAKALYALSHHVVPLPAKPAPVQAAENPLAAVQRLIRAAGPSGLPMADLSRALQKLHPKGLPDWLGANGPRAFLALHPDRFDTDPRTSGARVRLKL
jgi:hypothetical protein